MKKIMDAERISIERELFKVIQDIIAFYRHMNSENLEQVNLEAELLDLIGTLGRIKRMPLKMTI